MSGGGVQPAPPSPPGRAADPACLDVRRLHAHLQAQVDLATGAPVACEVRARYDHPRHGLIGPSRFLAPVIAAGGATTLFTTMLQRACDAVGDLAAHGVRSRIAVDLDGTTLRTPGFDQRIIELVSQRRTDPQLLCLQLTGRSLAADTVAVLPGLLRLRAHGFDLSIDDFGTGRSSLAQVVDLPVSQLKLDRRFVHALGDDVAAREVVRAVCSMARRMGLSVVADGVEDAEQADIAAELGCHRGQGGLWHRPSPVGEVIAELPHIAVAWTPGPDRGASSAAADSTSAPPAHLLRDVGHRHVLQRLDLARQAARDGAMGGDRRRSDGVVRQFDAIGSALAATRDAEALAEGSARLDLRPVVLTEVLRDTLAEWGLRAVLHAPTEVSAVVDEQRLRTCLSVLLDESARACGPEGVAISVTEAHGDVVVLISSRARRRTADTAAEQAPQEEQHPGLALSYARMVADAHGGRVHVLDGPVDGSSLRLSLPRGVLDEGGVAGGDPPSRTSG